MSDYGDNKSIMKLSLIKNYKSKITHRKKPVCLRGPCTRASPKYVKCPKKDSVIKVSLESDLLFSVEI